MANILDEWHPGALRACGFVLLVGGIVLLLLGLLGGLRMRARPWWKRLVKSG
jgi:hypothetical protein